MRSDRASFFHALDIYCSFAEILDKFPQGCSLRYAMEQVNTTGQANISTISIISSAIQKLHTHYHPVTLVNIQSTSGNNHLTPEGKSLLQKGLALRNHITDIRKGTWAGKQLPISALDTQSSFIHDLETFCNMATHLEGRPTSLNTLAGRMQIPYVNTLTSCLKHMENRFPDITLIDRQATTSTLTENGRRLKDAANAFFAEIEEVKNQRALTPAFEAIPSFERNGQLLQRIDTVCRAIDIQRENPAFTLGAIAESLDITPVHITASIAYVQEHYPSLALVSVSDDQLQLGADGENFITRSKELLNTIDHFSRCTDFSPAPEATVKSVRRRSHGRD